MSKYSKKFLKFQKYSYHLKNLNLYKLFCLAVGEQLIIDDSQSIPSNTQQNLPDRQSWVSQCLRWFTVIRPQLDVVVSYPLFIPSNHLLQKWVDFPAIRRWKFGPWVFFVLAHVAPIERASFCIQPYWNGSKRFFVQCLVPGKSQQCLHNVGTPRFLLFYWYLLHLAFQSVVHLCYQNYLWSGP